MVRFGNKLPLPKGIQDNIAKLRITPAAYKPFRLPPKHNAYRPKYEPRVEVSLGNWREQSLREYVSKVKDKGDPEYFEVFSMLNKITAKNLVQMSDEIIAILHKKDQEFRLRVTTLLFHNAISEPMFTSILADCAIRLNAAFPDVAEDFRVQAKMFSTLYDTTTTLTYPQSSEENFNDKIVMWMRQKMKRRGFAKFTTQLFIRGLIEEDLIVGLIKDVLVEVKLIAAQPKSEQTEENTTQYVDFLYETSKALPATSKDLKLIIRTELTSFLQIPRQDLPSLCMRSKFRVEDALKCVQ
jgi:hypothetical protein